MMTNNKKVALIILILITIGYVKFAFFSPEKAPISDVEVSQNEETDVDEEEVKKKEDTYITVFFIGKNENGEELYRAVKRKYDKTENGQQLSFAVSRLIEGPNQIEREKGIYSEIPTGTKVISVVETDKKAIVNLTSAFDQGGGTDGLYKRLYQLVKTVNKNTKLPVYLYIDNKQADVIGGEGLMINQPLNERVFNE
mgnify:CR=1 FL=1